MFNIFHKKPKIKPPKRIVWVNGSSQACVSCKVGPGVAHTEGCVGGIHVASSNRSPLRTLVDEETGLCTVYCPSCHAEMPAGDHGFGLEHLKGCVFYGT